MGGRSSKTSSHCFYITAEQQNAALFICRKLNENVMVHNKMIVERYFGTYPDYGKYFMAITNVEANKISSNPEVLHHWETVMKWLEYVAKTYNRGKQNIEYHINYLALCHKDMDITLEDLEKYTFAFITYLNNIHLSRNSVNQLMGFMSLLFRSIDEKIVLIKMIEQQSENLVVTPEILQLSESRRDPDCYCGCVRLCKIKEPFDLPYALHFNDEHFWITRKEFWRQQLYWIKDEEDFGVPRITSPTILSERSSLVREVGSVESPTMMVSREINFSLLETFPQSLDKIYSDEKNDDISISHLVEKYLNNLERNNTSSYSSNLLVHNSGSNVNVNHSDSEKMTWSEKLSAEIFKASQKERLGRSLSVRSWSQNNMKPSIENNTKSDNSSNPVNVQTVIADDQSSKAMQYERRSSTSQRPSTPGTPVETHDRKKLYHRNSLARKRRREMKRRDQNDEKNT